MKFIATALLSLSAIATGTAAAAHAGHGALLGDAAEHGFAAALVCAVVVAAVVIARRAGRNG